MMRLYEINIKAMNHDKLINWDNEAFYIINLKNSIKY